MNHSEIPLYFMMTMLVVLSLALPVAFLENAIYEPHAAEEATKRCTDLGYDNYESFSRQPFSSKALGIKCRYESRYDVVDGKIIVNGGK